MQPILQHIDPSWKSRMGGWITDDSNGVLTFRITQVPKLNKFLPSTPTTLGLYADIDDRVVVRSIPGHAYSAIDIPEVLGYVPKRINRYLLHSLHRIRCGYIGEQYLEHLGQPSERLVIQAIFYYNPVIQDQVPSIIQSILMEKAEIQEEAREQNEIYCLRI